MKMNLKDRLAAFSRNHFWLTLAYVIVIQIIAMVVLLSDSGSPLLLYQGF